MTEPANYGTEYSTIVCLIIIVNIIFSGYFKYYFTYDHFFFTVRSPCQSNIDIEFHHSLAVQICRAI